MCEIRHGKPSNEIEHRSTEFFNNERDQVTKKRISSLLAACVIERGNPRDQVRESICVIWTWTWSMISMLFFASVTLGVESTAVWSTRSCLSSHLGRRRQTIWTGIEESVGNTSDSHASSGHRCDRCSSYHDRWAPATRYRAEWWKTSTHLAAPWWTGNLQSTIRSALLKRLLPLIDTREIRTILWSTIIDWLLVHVVTDEWPSKDSK